MSQFSMVKAIKTSKQCLETDLTKSKWDQNGITFASLWETKNVNWVASVHFWQQSNKISIWEESHSTRFSWLGSMRFILFLCIRIFLALIRSSCLLMLLVVGGSYLFNWWTFLSNSTFGPLRWVSTLTK